MKNTYVKQVVTGLVGTILSIAFFILSVTMLKDLNQWLTYAAMAIGTGGSLGFIMYIFGGKSSFFYGIASGSGLIIFMVLAYKLPGMWKGLFIAASAIAFIALPVIKEYRVDREKNATVPKNKKLAKKLREEEEFEKQMDAANAEFLSAIRFGEKALLLKAFSGGFYQCIKENDKFYFIYIGSELSGIKPELIITDFSKEDAYISKKKDFIIGINEFFPIIYKTDKRDGMFVNSGVITVESRKVTKKFLLLESISLEAVKEFFHGIKIEEKTKARKEKNEFISEKNKTFNTDRNLIARLKSVVTVFTFISVAVTSAFMFLGINYKVMSLLCMGIFISMFILYLKYNGIISLIDKKGSKTFTKDRVNATLPFLVPSFGLVLRSLLDFDLTSFKMFIIWSGIIFGIILFMFFKFTSEYKKEKSAVWLIILAALFFAPAAVVQINYIFDYSKVKIVQSEIYDMRISKGSKSPDTYNMKVIVPDGKKMELKVTKEFYQSKAVGDKVDVAEKQGFLKIPYAAVLIK